MILTQLSSAPFSRVYTLLQPFVELTLLRRRPQDLPHSMLLLAIVLTAHALIGVLLFLSRLGAAQALLAGALGTVLLCVLTASLLSLNGYGARVVQTVTAMAGADVVIGLIALPVNAWLHGSIEAGAAGGLPGLLFLALLIWNLTVAGHILRHAMSAPLPLGLVIALVFYVLSVSILNGMFPEMD